MGNFFSDNIGFQSAGLFNLGIKEAFIELTEHSAILVDVREPGFVDFKRFDVPNIIYLAYSLFNEKYQELPEDKPLILADSVGLRSKEAMLFLQKLEYMNIANLPGGIVEWERQGFPTAKNVKEQYSGSCMCQLRQRNKLIKYK